MLPPNAARPWSAASALMGLGRDIRNSLTQLALSWAQPEGDPLQRIPCTRSPYDNSIIAVGTAAGRLRLVNALTGDSLLNVEHHEGHSLPVLCVAVSSDGSLLASGCRDRTWKLWDSSGTELQCRKGHSDAVWAIAVSPAPSEERCLLTTYQTLPQTPVSGPARESCLLTIYWPEST